MDKKTAIVTGANTGMGKETARALAAAGMRVVMACRDPAKAAAAAAEIKAGNPGAELKPMALDLSSFASVRGFASAFLKEESRLDILVNNAGVSLDERMDGPDGIEWTLAVNHFGPFLLTNLLLPRMKTSAPARIVTVSSGMHAQSKLVLAKDGLERELELRDLYPAKGWSGYQAYADSKLMNVLFTRELARRAALMGVSAYCLNPGLVRSEFFRNYKKLPGVLKLLLKTIGKDPPEGAKTAIHLCLEPGLEGRSGAYFDKCEEVRASAAGRNDAAAAALWKLSEKLTGVA
jgi:NAD(P)-dependent dehydrogenase (short-subunit alcohol dehydrogenase family)